MQITIIQIGKTKHSFFQEAEAEYLKRLQPFAKVKNIVLKEANIHGNTSELREAEIAKVKEKEAEEIIKNFLQKSLIIALDEKGKQQTSKEFAEFIKKQRDFEGANITFIIGGPYGLHENVMKRVQLRLSFSEFTFTHEMIRTILLEQLYRAFTIIHGKTYHYE